MTDIPVITIDGPSGSGKGTVTRLLAEKLRWHILDSGAIYRVCALAALDRGLDLDSESDITPVASHLAVDFESGGPAGELQVRLHGEDVTARIRTEECGNAASRVARHPAVRQALLQRQRDFRQLPGLIADGRDMGTVVFADAPLKIFLSASAEERAKRRYKQLKEQGFSVNLARLSTEIAERDIRDTGRSESPLRPAPDAVVIDTTGITVETIVAQILALAAKAVTGLGDDYRLT